MPNSERASVNFAARCGLALVFIYHGLVPKIIWPSEIERQLVELHHLDFPVGLLSTVAGILEVALGVSILMFRRSLIPIYLAAVTLALLLIDVAVVFPALLVKAFNPVTINLVSILLCYIVIKTKTRP